MALEIQVALIGLSGALVGGGLTSWVTWMIAKNERTRFAGERFYEARRQGYTEITAALAAVERYSLRVAHKLQDGDIEAYENSELYKLEAQTMSDMGRTLVNAYTTNRIVMSDEMAARLKSLIQEVDAIRDRRDLSTFGEIDSLYGAYKLATADSLAIAREELKYGA
jgi:hypothetical protein